VSKETYYSVSVKRDLLQCQCQKRPTTVSVSKETYYSDSVVNYSGVSVPAAGGMGTCVGVKGYFERGCSCACRF